MATWFKEHFAMITIVLLAAALSVPMITGSFWWEETHQAMAGVGFANIWTSLQPPFLYLMINLAAIFSQSEWWLRLLTALIPSLLTAVGVYMLGRKIANKKVGLIAALLLITNSFFIYYAGELGNYAWTMCFAVFSWLFLLEKMRIGQDMWQVKRRSQLAKFFNLFPISHDLFLFLACTILGLYTSYLYIFVVAVQLIYIRHKKDYRTFIYSITIPTAAYLPWLPQLFNQIKVTRTLQDSFPGFANLLNLEVLRAPTLTLGKFIFGILPIEENWFYLAILIILGGLLMGFLCAYPGAVWRYNRKKIMLLVGMLVCPLALAVLASVAFPILQARRVIFLLPFFYALLTYLLFGLETNKKITPWSYLILSFLLLINLYGTFIYYNAPTLQRENWRGVITQVGKSVPINQTLVIFPNLEDFSPWQWYGSEQMAVLSLQSRDLSEGTANFNLLGGYLDNYRYLVVFDYLRGIVDPDDFIGQQLEKQGFTLLKNVGDEGVGSVNIYVKENENASRT